MPARTIYQIGEYKTSDCKYPIFDTPKPPINIGDTVVLKYLDGSTDVVAIRASDSIAIPRCVFCRYGGPQTGIGNCPVHYQDHWGCIFDCGYAVSVDKILEEL